MEDFLEISLMPINIKKLMCTVRKLCICVAVGAFTLLSFMWVVGVFDSYKTGIACSLLFLLVNIPPEYTGLYKVPGGVPLDR